ncbi:MAG: hypothetical protein IBX62_06385 [Coriobacteriia bacterium]|nr:hypothetical protein [Coriobacteriia bacterium]
MGRSSRLTHRAVLSAQFSSLPQGQYPSRHSQGGSFCGGCCCTTPVANVYQIVTLDKAVLTDRVGMLPEQKLDLVLFGIDVVLGR